MTEKTGLTFVCPVCGKSVYRYPSEVAKGCALTCGRACRKVLQRRGDTMACGTCGKDFYRRQSQASQGYGNYCSKPCWAATRAKRQSFQCKICGSAFERTAWQIERGHTNVCSKACHTIWLRGDAPNIRVGLFSEKQKREWKGDRCERCGSPGGEGRRDTLQLDHIIPRCLGGKPTKDNAQTLCRECNLSKYWGEDRQVLLSRLAG